MAHDVVMVAWSGGALFAASLAFCAYRVFVSWAAVRPFAGAAAIWTNAALFAVFALHHSLFARRSIKDTLHSIIPEPLIRPIYVWAASLLLTVALAAWRPIGGSLYAMHGWARLGSAAAQGAGLWLIVRAAGTIDPLQLAGIRPETVGILQTGGPYRLVRHPLYLGWILIVAGTAHMTGDRLAFAILSSGYLLAAIPWEERSLRLTFGPGYDEYARRVRWRVIPYIY